MIHDSLMCVLTDKTSFTHFLNVIYFKFEPFSLMAPVTWDY